MKKYKVCHECAKHEDDWDDERAGLKCEIIRLEREKDEALRNWRLFVNTNHQIHEAERDEIYALAVILRHILPAYRRYIVRDATIEANSARIRIRTVNEAERLINPYVVGLKHRGVPACPTNGGLNYDGD